MSTLRDALLPLLNSTRGIPVTLGIRTTRVYVRRGAWDGGEALLGALTNTDTEITPRPKVVAIGNGRVRIGPITPSHSTGGWSPAQLNPVDAIGDDHYFILVGASGKLNPYRPYAYDGRSSLHYTVFAEQLDRNRPNEDW